ncbi:MAG: sulfotransferase domain-containing protein [Methyloceanibacter sp.]
MEKRYCTWLIDSDRWRAFRPRPDDIIVATYPKSGTTWIQRILSMLIFRSEEPVALDRIFPWWEVNRRPIEAVVDDLEAQRHRRSVKTHVPFDGVPRFDAVKYIHVARDGRDVCMSYHNHCTGFLSEALERMDAVGLAEPTLRRPYPRVDLDPAIHFHHWLTAGAIPGENDGTPYLSYFAYEKTFWDARIENNLLFVHYDDLQTDMIGEMRRIADFLKIEIPDADLSRMADSASFESMRKDAAVLIPEMAKNFEGGALRLVNKGQSGRWRGVYDEADVELFENKLRSAVPDSYADWLLAGRIAGSGVDPSQM